MGQEELKDIGDKLGIKPDVEDEGPGRPAGAKGPLPNLKTMTKKEMITELGKSRKRLKEFDSMALDAEGVDDISVLPPEMWSVFPVVIYDHLADRFGPHWKLKEKEAVLYGQNIERVSNKYIGLFAGNHPELFGLAMVLTATAIPRVLETISIRNALKKAPGPDADLAAEKKEDQL